MLYKSKKDVSIQSKASQVKTGPMAGINLQMNVIEL